MLNSEPYSSRFKAQCILRISRVVSDLESAESFYRDALGFHTVARGRLAASTFGALDPDQVAEEVVMRLGGEEISLVRSAAPGRPYPPQGRSDDLWFQHLAIVVNDMDAAYAHLCSCREWRPISEGGPQALPLSNGAVRAFKFRDPDGHPLELLWLPPGQGRPIWHAIASNALFLGIDHTAISVSSTRCSLRFYEALGFRREHQSLNHGPAQTRLDDVPAVRVRVTELRPISSSGPGLELLAYRPPGRPAGNRESNDLITDWVTLAVSPSAAALPLVVHDPDQHRFVLVDQRASAGLSLAAQ